MAKNKPGMGKGAGERGMWIGEREGDEIKEFY